MKKNLEKLRKIKFHVAPEGRNIISDQETKEIFNETLEKIIKERGEEWFESHSYKEVVKTILASSEKVFEEHEEKKAQEAFVNKLTEGLMKLGKQGF